MTTIQLSIWPGVGKALPYFSQALQYCFRLLSVTQLWATRQFLLLSTLGGQIGKHKILPEDSSQRLASVAK